MRWTEPLPSITSPTLLVMIPACVLGSAVTGNLDSTLFLMGGTSSPLIIIGTEQLDFHNELCSQLKASILLGKLVTIAHRDMPCLNIGRRSARKQCNANVHQRQKSALGRIYAKWRELDATHPRHFVRSAIFVKVRHLGKFDESSSAGRFTEKFSHFCLADANVCRFDRGITWSHARSALILLPRPSSSSILLPPMFASRA